jgi:hypothetical protein
MFIVGFVGKLTVSSVVNMFFDFSQIIVAV